MKQAHVLIIIAFLLSTVFFLWQHSANISWDFSAYASNANYWSGGNYYEVSRPPLVPVMLYLMGAGIVSEYLLIIIASLLFLYSSMRFADAAKIRREVFYLLSLSPIVLIFGTVNGSELLSLALLELFFVYLIQKKHIAGVFLGLSCLARYSSLIFLPLILWNRPKKIVYTLLLFLATLIPWLLFNYLTTGNILTSIADSYALNFKYRDYYAQPASIFHIMAAISFLAPLFVAGLWKTIAGANRKPGLISMLKKEKINILLLVIFALSLYQYLSTPSKELRYLFPVALPVAYFSTIGAEWLGKRKTGAVFAAVIIALNIGYVTAFHSASPYETSGKYNQAIDALHERNLSECYIQSNAWPILNYLGQKSEPTPRIELVESSIQKGNLILIFPATYEPSWARNETFIEKFPVIHRSENMILLGNGCNPPGRYEYNYMLRLKEQTLAIYNVTINTNPCFVIFSNEPLERFCNAVNGKGASLDENRETGLELSAD